MWMLLTVLFCLTHANPLFAYKEKTHIALNRQAVLSSSLGKYLNTNLNFASGILQMVNGNSVSSIIESGGEFEDQGSFINARYYNHFHNPLKPWTQAGLDDIIQILPGVGKHITGEPSLLWAQYPPKSQQPSENWSWHDARNYFYQALTTTDAKEREKKFADTFRAVGQVMHLVQDVSVPAHTRNDAHILSNFETWVVGSSPANAYDVTSQPPIFPTVSLLESPGELVPITQLWDTDQYTGAIPLGGTNIGLAEFSNANFLSPDTLFIEDPDHRHYFPYPSKSNIELWVDDNGTETTSDDRQYFRKTGPGEPVEHLAAASFAWFYRWVYFPQFKKHIPVVLDDKTYQEQADKLVPRAIGYSARLLDYFFRGDLIGKAATFNENRKEVQLKVMNATPDEAAGPGTLLLVARFNPKDSETEQVLVSSPEDAPSLPRSGDEEPLYFTFKFGYPIPEDAENLMMTVVFRGALGAESDAVMGYVFDPHEPDYAFIIQDKMILNSSPALNPVNNDYENTEYDCPGCPHYYRYATSSLERKWSISRQVLRGRFVPYGEIWEIKLEFNNPCQSNPGCILLQKPVLSIDGEEIPDGAWLPSDPYAAPKTWQVSGMPIYSRTDNPTIYEYGSAFPSIKVTMKDKSVFVLGLNYFTLVTQLGAKYLFLDNFLPNGGFLSSGSYAQLFYYPGYWQTPDFSIGGEALYHLIELSELGPTNQSSSRHETGNYSLLGDQYPYDHLITDGLYVGIVRGVGMYNYGSSFYCSGSLCQGGLAVRYDNTNTPDPGPLTIQGRLQRNYSEEERDVLLRRKIPQIQYDLIIDP